MTGERRSPQRKTEGHNGDRTDGFVSSLTIAQSLACGKRGCGCAAAARTGHGLTHCPAHEDTSPSLSLSESGARVLVHCQAGCTQDAVIDALRERGLWPEGNKAAGLTLTELAAAKGLPVTFLRELGVRDGVAGRDRDPCVDFQYCSEAGEVKAVHKRLRLTGEPRFIWRTGDHVLPYGLPRLHEARAAGQLVLVEGESDELTLQYIGIPALGMPGASTWRSEWMRYLEGITNIYVWREPDAGGDALAAKVTLDIPDVRIIEAPADAKDASALYLQDRAAFADHMQELMDKARPACDLRAEALTHKARQAYQQGHHILKDPALVDRIGAAIQTGGFAGNLIPAKLVYIAMTSRLLPRPLNISLIAPSAAGKNAAIDAALDLMPASAYHLEGAGSARALIYGDADYEHKTVIVAEADSIPEDGPAASAVRALATDNRMEYDVVERDSETGKFTVRHIVKPGPTGLITTSTKPLGEQMSTRLLTVGVADTPEQTRAVLAAHAATVNGSRPMLEVDALVAAQRWLELAGDRDVIVPFASALAGTVPADLVRMRRDFRQLLTVIQAVALLYQRQRQRDANGRIIATLDDYAQARDLLLDVFTEAATGGVSQAVRKTVKTLVSLYDGTNPVTVTQLTAAGNLHRTTVWRRVQAALRLGFVVSTETRKGQPAKLIPGDPLPEERPALPLPGDVVSWVSSSHPETDATVQQADGARYEPVSEQPVADPVAAPSAVAQPQPPVQPPMQPLERPLPNGKMVPEGPAVALLHGDPHEKDTPTCTPCPHRPLGEVEEHWQHADDGRRMLALDLWESLCFPPIPYKPGETIFDLQRWLTRATDEEVARVVELLEAVPALKGGSE